MSTEDIRQPVNNEEQSCCKRVTVHDLLNDEKCVKCESNPLLKLNSKDKQIIPIREESEDQSDIKKSEKQEISPLATFVFILVVILFFFNISTVFF